MVSKNRTARAAEGVPKEPSVKRIRTKQARKDARLKSSSNTTIESSTKVNGKSTAPAKKKSSPEKKRTNHSKDDKMKKAVEEWDAIKAKNLPFPPSMAEHANKNGIKVKTFEKYACSDRSKRRKIGSQSGRKSIVSEDNAEFLIQHTIRADRANEGLTQTQVQHNLETLQPELLPKQAKNYIARTFKKKAVGKIKPRPVKAQKTTAKRSQCTVAQQYRWFKNYDKALRFLREKNTGVCNKTGKSFGEVIEHFVLGGDETCLMADADGELRIMGEAGKKKHEKRGNDSRISCTMYRTFNAAGNNGPTGFIMQGKKRKPGYTDKFLEQSGCAKGSTIVMTENAFMTDAAWEEMADTIVTGYRSLPIVRDNPQWWMIEIFDGFGAHLNNLPALKKRVINKILSLKEEGDSSSINQAYDKNMAKEDKRIQRQALGVLRQETMYCKNLFCQWKLLICGLAAVRHSDRHPEIGIGSMIAVNLHPKHQIPFKEWCKKIEAAMQASDSFDLVTREDVDVYTLLPAMWRAMVPSDKQAAVDIVKRYGENAWDLNCISELTKSLKVPLSELVALQSCIFLAIENPSHINRGLEEQAVAPVINQEVADVEANRKTALDGLSLFQRNPEELKGMDAFYHQVNFRQRAYAKKPDEHKINPALMVSPRNHHQRALMNIDYAKKVQGTLMSDICEGVPREKAARVRLDNVAQIKHQSQFVNDPLRIERLEMRLQLQESLGMTEAIEQRKDEEKLDKEKLLLSGALPDALKMFKAGETELRKFQIKHARAMLIIIFGFKPKKKSISRKELLQVLKEETAKNPNKAHEYEPQQPSLLAAVEGSAVAGAAGELASIYETAPGLYSACVDAVETMESPLTPLELAVVCLGVVREIESSDGYESDEYANEDYSLNFFQAFGDRSVAKTRDTNFIFQLSEMVHEMIADQNLTEAALRKEMKKYADSDE